MISVIFGKRLKELRNNNNYTQQDLASILNLSKSCICNYEKGKRIASIDTLIIISSIFKVNIEYLIGIEIHIVDENKELFKASLEEIKIIKELRNNYNLYYNLIYNQKRTIYLINKKLGY